MQYHIKQPIVSLWPSKKMIDSLVTEERIDSFMILETLCTDSL